MSIELVMPSHHLILCHPLFLPPWVFPNIRVFSNESALCIRWPKYWSFSFSISPSNEYSGLISFRMDWFDLLAVQETPKSLPQHCQNFWLLIKSLHHQFIHSFNKYLLRTGCVPGTSLMGVCPSVNEQSLASCGWHLLVEIHYNSVDRMIMSGNRPSYEENFSLEVWEERFNCRSHIFLVLNCLPVSCSENGTECKDEYSLNSLIQSDYVALSSLRFSHWLLRLTLQVWFEKQRVWLKKVP